MTEIVETLAPDAAEPEAVGPENAIDMLCAAQQVHMQLSQMADQKASILMGTTFVIFTIAVGQTDYRTVAFAPLLVLGSFAFASAVMAVMAILPALRYPTTGPVNMLFFGSFKRYAEDEYIRRMLAIVRDDEAIFATMARDIYQNGSVLHHKKYRYLAYAYRVFLIGLSCSLLTFLIQLALHLRH